MCAFVKAPVHIVGECYANRMMAQRYQGARAAGLQVVVDRTVKIEHARLFGGLNWARMNAGVISARRPS